MENFFRKVDDTPIVIDGFPENKNQAKKFDILVKSYGKYIEHVIMFNIKNY